MMTKLNLTFSSSTLFSSSLEIIALSNIYIYIYIYIYLIQLYTSAEDDGEQMLLHSLVGFVGFIL
jgi:hypothetical protein